MTEIITEMIIPGVYIEVRAEGLLTIGGIATGNIALLGTAERGDDGIHVLSSLEEGRARYGGMGEWDDNDLEATQGNLTLVRAMNYIFGNGARTVYARRVYDPNTAQAATYQIRDESQTPVLTLRAKTPGRWGNRLQVRVEAVDERELVSGEEIFRSNGTLQLTATAVDTSAGAEAVVGSVTVVDQGLRHKYQIKQSGASSEVVQVDPGTRRLTFNQAPSAGAEIRADYFVPAPALRRVTLRFDNVQEVYVVPSINYLAQQLQNEREPSQLVEVVEDGGGANANVLPLQTTAFQPFSGGENGGVDAGMFRDALEEFVEENVQLVLVAGLSFSGIRTALLGHVEKTENIGRERIAIAGTDDSNTDHILENANAVADKRVVLVAPGLLETDPATGRVMHLPPFFAAAAVCGKLGAFAPHISLTNKTLAGIEALEANYNYGQLKQLVQNRVLGLQLKRGIRVVRGITTHDEAFQQITLRRIVDFVKEGVRIGSSQYIGKLNNRRVRENLRTTLDSFLATQVRDELLTGYALDVFADRAMEIRGEVRVTIDMMPTFSIDYVRVTMNLQ